MRMCDLSTALQLSPSGLTRRLDGLVKMRLVERVASPIRSAGDVRSTHPGWPAPSWSKQRPITSPASARASSRIDPATDPATSATSSTPCAPTSRRARHDRRSPQGFRAYVANVGIKDDTDDFVVVAADAPCIAAGVFTTSSFAGPSVVVSREHLALADCPGRRGDLQERQRGDRQRGTGQRPRGGRRGRPRRIGCAARPTC